MYSGTVALASDHAGWLLKQTCISHLQKVSVTAIDLGPYSRQSCDYPEFAAKLCLEVRQQNTLGILICGTGLGMSMAANRFTNIRGAVCTNELMAQMARKHNNANVLCLGARVVGEDLATNIVDAFINTEYEGGRHQRRIDLLENLSAENK